MVTELGMSEKLGPLLYGENEEEVFLGHSVTQRKNISDATAHAIDEEIRRFVETAENEAKTILTEHDDDLHKVAKALLEYETLSGDEVKALLRGEPIIRPSADEESPTKKKGRRGSVPTTRGPKGQKPGGLEPEPQPGT